MVKYNFNETYLDDALISEASINIKSRNINNAINLIKHGKSGFNNIKTFGIVTAMNPDSIQTSAKENKRNMNLLSKCLKDSHYPFIRQKGHFGGNNEYSYFIFNIKLNTLIYYAAKFEQTSFFFCELKNNKVINHYYEKQDTSKSFHKKYNPYILIETTSGYIDAADSENYSELGGKFKYTIPLKYFDTVNEQISENLKYFNNDSSIIEKTMNQVGIHPWYVQQKLYKNLY